MRKKVSPQITPLMHISIILTIGILIAKMGYGYIDNLLAGGSTAFMGHFILSSQTLCIDNKRPMPFPDFLRILYGRTPDFSPDG